MIAKCDVQHCCEDAPDGVCEGVGCARRYSLAARNDSGGVFVNSKLRASSTIPRKITKFFDTGSLSTMATSPMKTRLSPKVF